jgi:hypothetical protein
MSRLYCSSENAVAVVASPDQARRYAHRIAMPSRFMSSISPTIAFNKDAFPNRRRSTPAEPNHSTDKISPIVAQNRVLPDRFA